MNTATVARFMAQADAQIRAWERDPVITPGQHGRADVASGRMSKWLRFNSAENLVWVTTPDGVVVALTRNQVAVLQATRSLSGTGVRVTMRSLADHLGLSPSTVWRAVVKLTAFGFVVYQTNRGRNGGTLFLTGSLMFGVDWLRDEAKAKVRAWRKAAEARISRLRGNVASCFPGRERELYQYRYVPTTVERNIYPAWTAESIQEALGER